MGLESASVVCVKRQEVRRPRVLHLRLHTRPSQLHKWRQVPALALSLSMNHCLYCSDLAICKYDPLHLTKLHVGCGVIAPSPNVT